VTDSCGFQGVHDPIGVPLRLYHRQPSGTAFNASVKWVSPIQVDSSVLEPAVFNVPKKLTTA
jgi:hypothetical protein